MSNLYIGWDVGAWQCTKGKNESCDAIVVMDDRRIIGYYRANLSNTMQLIHDTPRADRPSTLIRHWFGLCNGEARNTEFSTTDHYYIAIDTPLRWPSDFKNLLNADQSTSWEFQFPNANIQNTLLYRYTERVK